MVNSLTIYEHRLRPPSLASADEIEALAGVSDAVLLACHRQTLLCLCLLQRVGLLFWGPRSVEDLLEAPRTSPC